MCATFRLEDVNLHGTAGRQLVRRHEVFHVRTHREDEIDNTFLLITMPVDVAINALARALARGGDAPVFGCSDGHVEICEVCKKLGSPEKLVAIKCTFRTHAGDLRKPLRDEEEAVVTTRSCGGRWHAGRPVNVQHQRLTRRNRFCQLYFNKAAVEVVAIVGSNGLPFQFGLALANTSRLGPAPGVVKSLEKRIELESTAKRVPVPTRSFIAECIEVKMHRYRRYRRT